MDPGSSTKPFFSFQDLVRTPATPMFGISEMFKLEESHVVATSTPTALAPAFSPSGSLTRVSDDDDNLSLLTDDTASEGNALLDELSSLHSDGTIMQPSSPIELEQFPGGFGQFSLSPDAGNTDNSVAPEPSGELPLMYEWANKKPLRIVDPDETLRLSEDTLTGQAVLSASQESPLLSPRGILGAANCPESAYTSGSPIKKHKGTPSFGAIPQVGSLRAPSLAMRYPEIPAKEFIRDEPCSDAIEEFKRVLRKRKLSQFQQKFVQDSGFRNSKLMKKKTSSSCPAADCNQIFTTEGYLAFHCDNHTRSELGMSCYCSYGDCPRKIIGFTCKNSLKRHEASVHGEPKYICNFCNVKFTRIDYLRKHQFRGSPCAEEQAEASRDIGKEIQGL